ncbi:MAG TPA: hypothetical protein VHX16_01825 [Chloroflexota bacterium]|nr:hypothetical protein [Chloroflexota bacterium]
MHTTTSAEAGHHRLVSGLTGVGHFVRHFIEMCLVMCAGFAVGDAVYFRVAGLLGYDRPFAQLPELSVLIVAFTMTAPMVVWMRFRGMAWRPILEMSAAMVIEAVVLIAAGRLGLLETAGLARLEHVLMMPVMLVPMLLRRDAYTGHAAHLGRTTPVAGAA